MSLLARLLGTPDPRDALRPLWHSTVLVSRQREWYSECGVADTVGGRFDMITLVLSLVLMRLEAAGKTGETALLTELFVEDMDGQLRESGVGDLVVGKRVGRLMEALGGRLGAYRGAMEDAGGGALAATLSRNVTLTDGAEPGPLARRIRELAAKLDATAPDDLVAGRIER
nr:ubiquinol-cytochrome C chaperone family protein [Croceibacterium sp. D39]